MGQKVKEAGRWSVSVYVRRVARAETGKPGPEFPYPLTQGLESGLLLFTQAPPCLCLVPFASPVVVQIHGGLYAGLGVPEYADALQVAA